MSRRSRFSRLLLCLGLAAFAPRVAPAEAYPESLFAGLRWRCIGPFRGGRTVGATGVPGSPNLFYVGVNNGGVWKSDDAGRVWTPIFDEQPTQSIGALAVAPSNPNVLYVGSGEGLQRPDLSVGDGVYKSTDAGKTWRHTGLGDAQQIAAVLVDPRDADRVYVAALGHPYGANEERGVFGSTDGGATWTKALYEDADTGAVALGFDPSNADVVYAVLWAARQAPWENGEFHGPKSGLLKSTDRGATWRRLTKGLPTFAQGLGRIGFGIAPSDAKRIYALVEADAASGGLYRSDDAGESWRRVNAEGRLWGRGSDFAEVKVHPKDPDHVFVANTAAYRSTDGGKSFVCFRGAPGGDDYHTIWINRENPAILLLAGDQGAVVSVNDGATWSSWYNQPTAQLYHVSTDDRFPYRVYGGQQESGSVGIVSRGDDGYVSYRDWSPVAAEEYGYVVADPLDPDLVYGGKLTRYRHSTRDAQDVSPAPLRGGAHRFLRTAPVVFSPTDPRVLYYAGEVLFKTTNGGTSWDVISPDLSREAPEVPPSVGVFRTAEVEASLRQRRRGVIYAVAPSPKEAGLIWAGTDDGLIHVTKDGGKTWTNVTPKGLSSWSKVSVLEASRFDAATAYAAINRFRLDDLAPHILATHDGGATWTEIVRGLPDAPVNAVREDPVRKGLLYAATERGVHVSFDDGASWQSLRRNLPATSVRDLVVHGDDLVVATHGRSFWILDDVSRLRQLGPEVVSAEAFLFRPQVATRVKRSKYPDTPLPPDEPVGENPPDGAILDYVLKGPASLVTLEVRDAAGRLVRRVTSRDAPEAEDEPLRIPTHWLRPHRPLAASAGAHRFVWDLHEPPPAALEHEYPISAVPGDTPREPLGPAVLPGVYSVSLAVDGKTRTRDLTVRMDPRTKATADDLAKQHAAATRLAAAMKSDVEALDRVRALRAEARERRKKATGKKLLAALDALDADLAALEGSAGRRGRGAGGVRDLTRLNADLVALYGLVEGADAAPTTQAMAALVELEESLASLRGRLAEAEKKAAAAAAR